MFERIVIATDGSAHADRAVAVALDLARRFDAAVDALYVVDDREVEAAPDEVREDYRRGLRDRGERAVAAVRERADREVTGALRTGRPPAEICAYAREREADLVAMGTRGRHGDDEFRVGPVAERVVRCCSTPVLTVRGEDG